MCQTVPMERRRSKDRALRRHDSRKKRFNEAKHEAKHEAKNDGKHEGKNDDKSVDFGHW